MDNLGGDVLAWMASTMNYGGVIAAVGLAASYTLNTVMPFILRGVSLLGVNSGDVSTRSAISSGGVSPPTSSRRC